MGFSRQEYWSGLPCPFLPQGIFLTQGLNPRLLCLLHWQAGSLGFSGGSDGKKSTFKKKEKNLPSIRETQVRSLGEEYPLGTEMMTHTPVVLCGKPHRHRNLVDYSPWGCKELDTTEQLTHTASPGKPEVPRSVRNDAEERSGGQSLPGSIWGRSELPGPE